MEASTMSLDELRKHVNASPFEPFDLCLANGDRYRVAHPENIAMGRSIVVVAFTDQDGTAWCTPHQIVSVTKPASAGASETRPNGAAE
jgi:hypothetical protein